MKEERGERREEESGGRREEGGGAFITPCHGGPSPAYSTLSYLCVL